MPHRLANDKMPIFLKQICFERNTEVLLQFLHLGVKGI